MYVCMVECVIGSEAGGRAEGLGCPGKVVSDRLLRHDSVPVRILLGKYVCKTLCTLNMMGQHVMYNV